MTDSEELPELTTKLYLSVEFSLRKINLRRMRVNDKLNIWCDFVLAALSAFDDTEDIRHFI